MCSVIISTPSLNEIQSCLTSFISASTLQLIDNLVSSSWFLRLVSKRIIYDWICESTITYRHLLGDGWLLPVTQVLLYNRLMELTQDLCGCITFIHHVLPEDTFSMWERDVTICATHIHSMLTWGTHFEKCVYFSWLNISSLWPETLTLKYLIYQDHKSMSHKTKCKFRAQTQTKHWHVRTPTLTSTSSFSNVPLRQIWSKLSIILGGTTYERAQQQSDMTGIY